MLTKQEFVNNYWNYGEDWLMEQPFTEEEWAYYSPLINLVDDWGQEYVDSVNAEYLH